MTHRELVEVDRSLEASVVGKDNLVVARVRVEVESGPDPQSRDVLAMARAFVERLEEWLQSNRGEQRRRDRSRRMCSAGFPSLPEWASSTPVVVDAPPLTDGGKVDTVDNWPPVALLSEQGILELDLERLVSTALDRHWGIRHSARAWLYLLLDKHPEATITLGYLALQWALEKELGKRVLRWSVETADLTPKQRETHAGVAAAMMRWKLQHRPDVVLQDATRAQVEEEAAAQYEDARVALQRAKWLRAIAAALPDDDSIVSEHLTADQVLELREAAAVSARALKRAKPALSLPPPTPDGADVVWAGGEGLCGEGFGGSSLKNGT